MFGKRMTRVYATSAISTVVVVSPVIGTSSWKSARLGIVYRSAAAMPIGCSAMRTRCATSASTNASANPITTAIAVSQRCCRSAG